MKKRVISILLTFLLSFSFFTGCTDNNKEQQSEPEGSGNVNTTISGTIHQFTMNETNDYIVKNGLTDYVVLMPNEYSEYLRTAKDEFVYFFKEATDIDIRVEYEDETGKTHNSHNKYISIGQTKLLESANLAIDYEQLEREGCRIKTKDKSVFIVGGSDIGTLYTVYDFFQLVFNYEFYYHNTFKIDRNVKNVKLSDFDVIDVPDISARSSQWGMVTFTESPPRYRMLKSTKYFLPASGNSQNFSNGVRIHNMSELVWDYETPEPEWLAANGGNQLCFTARGNEEKYNMLVNRIVKNLIEYTLKAFTPKDYPDANYVAVTIEDTGCVCSCEACAAAHEKYGADSGQAIVLCNDVMAKLKDWMNQPGNEEYRRDDLKLVFFAYEGFLDAPAVLNEQTGKYEYKDQGCVMRDDVAVYYAVNRGLGYMINYSSPASDVGKERLKKWGDLTDNLMLWLYPINYLTIEALHDSYNFFTDEFYRALVEGGATYCFMEGAGAMLDTTAFEGLKAFLDYKLLWNASLNSYDLTKEWFEAMYGDAAQMMYDLFQEEREYCVEFFYSVHGLDGSLMMQQRDNMSNWDITTLFNWMNVCEEAMELVEKKYKEYYPEEYERLMYNIELEYLSPAYMLLKCYGAQIQGAEREELLTKLKDRLSDKKKISNINSYINSLS